MYTKTEFHTVTPVLNYKTGLTLPQKASANLHARFANAIARAL